MENNIIWWVFGIYVAILLIFFATDIAENYFSRLVDNNPKGAKGILYCLSWLCISLLTMVVTFYLNK